MNEPKYGGMEVYITYLDCDRCGERLQKDFEVSCEYENGILCSKCNQIRQFDDKNPILYPMKD